MASPAILDTPPVWQQKDVKEKIDNLKPSHSSGPDNITSYVLKKFSENLCKPLSILYNKSIESNIIPEDWKLSNVIPIHKKGSKGDPSNSFSPQ